MAKRNLSDQRQSAKRNLSDRTLKAIKKPSDGVPYDIRDTIVPGLRVRVSETGRRTFVLLARFPGSPISPKTGTRNPTRRAIGEYGAITLEKARVKARDWLELIRKGVDPKHEEERLRVAEDRKRENSFRAVAEEFIRLAVVRQRQGHTVKTDIEREFIPVWGSRPITDITADDVIAIIDATVARGKPYMAHNLLGHVRRLFNWAIARRVYGLERSPCDRMRPKEIIGAKKPRSRILDDAELKALWAATEKMGYPYGPLLRMLALTGQRKSEVAEAQWPEFDLEKKKWIIPAERMKADAPHVVPLTDDVIAILKSLPRFKKGDCLFSINFGQSPVSGFSRAKTTLDKEMAAELRRKIAPFVIHDIRRTMRTGLSALPVSSDVAELVIAHARPGMRRVYDQHKFEDEKRHALELWAARFRSIVIPPPANVIQLRVSE